MARLRRRPRLTPAEAAAKRAEWVQEAYLAHHAGRLDGAALRRLLNEVRRA